MQRQCTEQSMDTPQQNKKAILTIAASFQFPTLVHRERERQRERERERERERKRERSLKQKK